MLNIEYVKPSELVPYENNAKLHPAEQIEQIKESIRDFGFNDPIAVWKDNKVIEGHGRLIASIELGLDEVPIIRLDNLTDDERKAYTLVHNKLTMNSGFDDTLLDLELGDIDIDMEKFGFELGDFGEENIEIVEDDVPETPAEPKTKLGDLYALGEHRLICGDSTDVNVIGRLKGGQLADMVFTDPPYGVSYSGGFRIKNGAIESNEREKIKNDSLGYDELYTFLMDAFRMMKHNTRPKSALYVFYGHAQTREFLNAFHDVGLKQRSIIIWHKTGGGFGDFMSQYMNAYEPCIYGSNGDTVNWYGATNEKTVWDMDKEKKCDLHPTMKPVALVARAVGNSSKPSDSVLDIFGGSGSTLIACEQLNRKCFMCELEPKYCDVIIERWENLTGQKAKLVEQ